MNPGARAPQSEVDELRSEVVYLRRRIEQLAASMVRADAQAAAIRHELEQKRRGFTLMGELAVTLGQDSDLDDAFHSISRRINGALNMQRTAVLTPTVGGDYVASVLQGYEAAERQRLAAARIALPPAMLDPLHPVLITGADASDTCAGVRELLGLPYLISTPVVLNGEVVAVLVTGRVREQRPFLPRLGRSDVETVQAVSAYLTAVLAAQRLHAAESLANVDPLTGLPNLRLARERLHQCIALAARDGQRAAVLFIDLDGFKAINDALGHAAGDAALCVVGERLAATVRAADTVGRIGGDEFVVVLSQLDDAECAGSVAAKVIEALTPPMDIYGKRCRLGASIGVAVYPDHGEDAATLVAAADEAMYAVKKAGKNAYRYAR